MNSDTICAISTPAGIGGIAVLRLAGSQAQPLALCSLRQPSGAPLRLVERRATFAHLLLDDGSLLDEVVVTLFCAPHSYCGDDTVEIACHGSRYIQQRALQLFVEHGARLAEPGEFTQRAFLNGRLDLSQAEAVADLIDARSQAAHSLAIDQMRGGYARELETLRRQLIDTTALLELELDFSDEDVEFASRRRLCDMVDELSDKVKRLVSSFQTGNAFKSGIPVAIIGRPNAGKSSLLNALLADDRAIVSPIPGTTRDTIEETMTLDGITFRFIDTAGLRDSGDEVERLGFDRSLKAARQARYILFVRELQSPAGASLSDDMAYIAERCDIKDKHLFVVHNKCDLPHESTPTGIVVSAKEGIGIDHLKQTLAQAARSDAQQNEGVLMTNARHFEAMQRLLAALREVKQGLAANLTPDLLVIDMRDALYHLGTITGQVTSDEVLSSVFSRFCVGK